ncbi:EscU/YscU/HrcU family type III secretion system export apparatus switch protein [Lampropedia aestuarii]|uniref:EscU/YscU/HrcU family type III secretion system export apparatus switch protein n=1 Tax=Lampropedia aestuarii TaxID=2562762 RepID=A0A4S5BKS9_9BURK|nr:type III secretion system export apparatus subunit SctU [Lampropedia aestuarii]MDH5857344.1 type III secretion system export apparatus subunit SctU [Lampropedia aestuarii]THJ31553.1 EscU/YscU/HrcU family type III secretion system export apparatus switch protein [Lampropedia aestuarii]
MSEKTEQPTSKKLRDSRKKGDVAYSKDFTQTVLIIAIFGYLLASGARIVQDMMEMILLPASLGGMEFSDAANILVTKLLKEVAWLMLPFLGIILGLGILADAMQVGLVLAFEKLKPSAKKLNVISNLKNIFSKKNLVEFLKSCLKIGFLSSLLWMLLRDAFPILSSIPQAGVQGMGQVMGALIGTMVINIGLAYTAIALADFAWQRYQHRKGLMMSKDEVKREYKEMDGDPQIKHKRKQLHQEMLQEGAVQNARKASVLVTNPTHLAVALYYNPEETPLPIVTAMGEGALAERMKQAAQEAGVPVMQNIPLARSLVAEAQVGQFIPSALVEPVAEILRLLRESGPDGIPLID